LIRFHIVVLSSLMKKKPPSVGEIVKAIHKLALPNDSAGDARGKIEAALEALRGGGMIDDKRRVTDAGRDALATGLFLGRAPSWKDIQSTVLPALALGLASGSDAAKRALATQTTLQGAVLGIEYGLGAAASPKAVAEQLLAAKLEMPALVVKDKRLLAHVLARRAGVEPKGDFDKLAARLAAAAVRARQTGKLREALARRWATEESGTDGDRRGSMTGGTGNSTTGTGGSTTGGPNDLPSSRPATQPGAANGRDDLAAAVRAAMSEVPSSGRYGEKIFISSLWEALPQGRPKLDDFKRWLVEANANQQLVLARADLVTAMNPEQVAASEIVDRGATFHFVLEGR
jgi:hypothetical protein